MNKVTLRIIIFLMAISTIGLLGFQLYWIKNAIHVNEERFRQDVHSALNAVAEKLERKEALVIAANKFAPDTPFEMDQNHGSEYYAMDYREFFLGQLDSIRSEMKALYQEPFNIVLPENIQQEPLIGNRQAPTPQLSPAARMMQLQQKIDSVMNRQLQSRNHFFDFRTIDSMIMQDMRSSFFGQFGYDPQTNSPSVYGQERNNAQSQSEIFQKRLKELNQQIDSARQERYKEVERKLEQKTELIAGAFDELFLPPKPIEQRLDKVQLDTLLRQELTNKGIDLDYQYGIINKGSHQVVMSSFPMADGNPNPGFQVNLFPNDIMGDHHFLSIMFPGQQKYLLNKIMISLTSSAFLMLVIICCFAIAIFTIIRQKKLSEIKNDFINNMTHEFKTPISTVSLACEALQDQEIRKDESFVSRYVNVIRDENTRLGRQVEKVLQAATLEKKDFKLKYENVDLHKIIEKALANVELMVAKREGKIVKKLEARNHEFLSDQVHLTNIIYNLLDNANKYSPEPPQIEIQTRDAPDGILIRISDQGIGMTREVTKKIFEKFYRAPTGNLHDVKGFGLGLTYVKTIVEAFGGTISVTSTPGKGSSFEVYLPKDNPVD
jgi:two-component system, OmpR family, phosphate regulon sensor histidine kinase PhoR